MRRGSLFSVPCLAESFRLAATATQVEILSKRGRDIGCNQRGGRMRTANNAETPLISEYADQADTGGGPLRVLRP